MRTSGIAQRHTPDVSVVFVTYNRLHHLRETLYSLLATISYPRSSLELIVCDDGSAAAIQEQIARLPFDVFLLGRANRGMGANTNKGLQAASGHYVLQLQDDWLCVGRGDFIEAALELFAERPDVGLIRLRTPNPSTPEQHRTASGRIAHIYPTGAFSASNEFAYTDNPHIKRRQFHEALGHYLESRNMCSTEIAFGRCVDAQDALKVAWIEGYCVFEHIGDDFSFNPGRWRGILRNLVRRHMLGRIAFNTYARLRRLRTYQVPGGTR